MHVVVVGNGKIGRGIAKQLVREGHDIVLIDNDEHRLSSARNGMDIITILGNGASRDIQIEAGVQNTDLLIAVTGGDELNLLCCLIAKKLGAKQTIARVRNPEYADQLSLISGDLGLSMAINPEYSAAEEIFSVLQCPGVITLEKFAKGKVQLVVLKISKKSEIINMSFSKIRKKYKINAIICAVRRDDETIIPRGDFKLRQDDEISFISSLEESIRFLKLLGVPVIRPKSVVIVGGGKISYYLTRMLKAIGVKPTIIDSDIVTCRKLGDNFPDCIIIHGDGADRELLNEEGISDCDAFVSVTGTDEVNILLSMYANRQNVPKLVTKISRISMIDLVSVEYLGSVISPKDIISSQIISYVRALENSGSSNVETLYRIADGAAEALEFVACKNVPNLIETPLKDIPLKKNILIGCIFRDGKVIIPDGNDTIQLGDHVIVVTSLNRLADLQDILK